MPTSVYGEEGSGSPTQPPIVPSAPRLGKNLEVVSGHSRCWGPWKCSPNSQQLRVQLKNLLLWQKGRINIWDSKKSVTGTEMELTLSQNSQANSPCHRFLGEGHRLIPDSQIIHLPAHKEPKGPKIRSSQVRRPSQSYVRCRRACTFSNGV